MDKELYKQIVVAIAPGVINDYHSVDNNKRNIYPLTKIANTIEQLAREIELQATYRINESNEQSSDNESKDNQDSDLYVARDVSGSINIYKGKPNYNAIKKEFTTQFTKNCSLFINTTPLLIPSDMLGYGCCAKLVFQPVKCDEIRER